MNAHERRRALRHRAVGTAGVIVVVLALVMAYQYYRGAFDDTTDVVLRAPRTGLMLDPGAKVQVRGVTVGTVSTVDTQGGGATIHLDLDPAQARRIPANTVATLKPTTLFGAKYVDLGMPATPVPAGLAAGDVISTTTVGPEADDVFQNVVDLLSTIQPQKINATLTAVSGALQGRGEELGETMTQFNRYLVGIQPGIPYLEQDFRLTAQVLPAYTRAAPDLVRSIEAFRTTSSTLVSQRRTIQDLLGSLTTAGGETTAVTLDAAGPLTSTVHTLRPTTAVLQRYSPELACFFGGVKNLSDLLEPSLGGTEQGATVSAGILNRVNSYRYPQDLPQVRADQGPNCWGLPRLAKDRIMPHVDFGTGSSPFTGPYGTARTGPVGR